MNVLSLFNGMSCGEIALREVGIIPEIYYSSEIDKHAIAQTQLNFPNTIQLGSVVDVDVSKLERIDLLIGGSPCQSFSFAGKRKGMSTKCEIQITKLEQYLELKAQDFEFEGQSYLFWEYMRILTDIRKYNPNVLFLLENVEMGAKWERVLSEAIGVYGVHINSALVSAQNRKRIYWSNIKTRKSGLFGEFHTDIPQPADKDILLRDILDNEVDEKYYLTQKAVEYMVRNNNTNFDNNKSSTIEQVYYKRGKHIQLVNEKIICHNTMPRSSKSGKGGTGHLSRNDGKTYCLDTGQTNAIEILNENQLQKLNPNIDSDKHNCVTLAIGRAGSSDEYMDSVSKIANITSRIRRLTPTECARLQTIPDWYKWQCSDTQQYKMLGNGWTIDVISHIFSFLT